MSSIALILAAGKGTRMKSDLPKPLVPFKNKPIVEHLVQSFFQAGIKEVALIVGYRAEEVKNTIGNKVTYIYQHEQKGTGHAVLQAKTVLDWKGKDMFVFVGDSPLVTKETIKKLSIHHKNTNASCTFLTADFPIKLPYGRVVKDENGKLLYCVEERNANPEELKINELITSHYIFKADDLFYYLDFIKPASNGEYYLTDIIEILIKAGKKVETLKIPEYQELVGLNTLEEIAWAEKYYDEKVKVMRI